MLDALIEAIYLTLVTEGRSPEKSELQDIAAIIEASSGFAWPVVALIGGLLLLFCFRKELSNLLERFTGGEGFGTKWIFAPPEHSQTLQTLLEMEVSALYRNEAALSMLPENLRSSITDLSLGHPDEGLKIHKKLRRAGRKLPKDDPACAFILLRLDIIERLLLQKKKIGVA